MNKTDRQITGLMKVNAHDCIAAEVSPQEAKEFLNANHRQKYTRAKISYGLYYNGELLSLMSLGKPRYNDNYKYEIIRDCTKIGYQVIGGISKLWSDITRNINISSCIVYSYPHNGNYVNKYVDYCGFKNIARAKPEKKTYFEGIWNGELKRIDKSILERQGVDRLLNGSFGHDRTNEEILLDLDFERREEDGYSPQIDIYYPFGLLYQIDDITDGSFYIGMTECKDKWDNGYLGSGSTKWKNHLSKYPPDVSHKYIRTVLRDDFNTPKELRDAEVEEIRKYCAVIDGKYVVVDPKCKNHKTTNQNTVHNNPVCSECGGKNGHHKSKCSLYKETISGKCEYCGTPAGGMHKRDCPNYIEIICEECGGKNHHHKRACSKYKENRVCPECGSKRIHKKTCSHYKTIPSCPECGGRDGKHHKECSRYKVSVCPECGGLGGQHKKTCSSVERCPECGNPYNHHKPTCSKYQNSICPECGGKEGNHYKTCSKAKVCPLCGSPAGHHKDDCPNNKICQECGGRNGQHRKGCSHSQSCPECGGVRGQHSSSCSHYECCPECGYSKQSRTHAPTCSHYKKRVKRDIVCEECGAKGNKHKPICSHYTPPKPCPECGGVRSHFKTCSRYKPAKVCPECGASRGHKKICSHYKRKS